MAAITSLPPVPPHQQSLSSLPSVEQTGTDHVAAADADNVPRGPVSATIHFYAPPEDGSKPHNYVEERPAGAPQRNFGDNLAAVDLTDIRGHEQDFELEKDAFAAFQGHPHNPKIDWHDDATIKTHYYPEVEKILLDNVPGSNRVLIFDHTVRRANPNAHRAPVTRAHIDQTPRSAAQRVRFHVTDEAEAEKLLAGRYRIINVWRPLNGKVQSFPLAFASSASVPDDDMVPVEHRYPDRTGETAAIRHNPDQKWHYWSGVDNDERIFLQCYDSAKPQNRVPHTAFVDPRSTDAHRPRESIEVRALVFG